MRSNSNQALFVCRYHLHPVFLVLKQIYSADSTKKNYEVSVTLFLLVIINGNKYMHTYMYSSGFTQKIIVHSSLVFLTSHSFPSNQFDSLYQSKLVTKDGLFWTPSFTRCGEHLFKTMLSGSQLTTTRIMNSPGQIYEHRVFHRCPIHCMISIFCNGLKPPLH